MAKSFKQLMRLAYEHRLPALTRKLYRKEIEHLASEIVVDTPKGKAITLSAVFDYVDEHPFPEDFASDVLSYTEAEDDSITVMRKRGDLEGAAVHAMMFDVSDVLLQAGYGGE